MKTLQAKKAVISAWMPKSRPWMEGFADIPATCIPAVHAGKTE